MHRRAVSIAIGAFGLGLIAPVAEGSCAGPLLSVSSASFEPVPPNSSDLDAEATYHVRAGQHVTAQASNLGPCLDTYSVEVGGCGQRTPSQPTVAPAPVRDVALHLQQGNRRWQFGSADATAPDFAIDYPVNLPRDLKPGRATLTLTGSTLPGRVTVRLQVS
ncbi:MAG TPA: hypothetical protein VEQ66_13040 [Propionibacteriaceae bacterium]|nr:hypothetical protein [Propionibacteriaceae bacterium]